MQTVIERVMAITRGDFLSRLPLATLPECRVYIDGDTILVEEAEQTIRILVREEPALALASLRLPQLLVRIECESMELSKKFMHRFDCAFQRGGG